MSSTNAKTACRKFASLIFATAQSRRITFPEPAYAAYAYINRDYDTTEFRYGYQSLVTPPSVFDYDMEKGKSTLLKQKEVPGGYDPRISGRADLRRRA